MNKSILAVAIALFAQGYALESSAAVLDFESLSHVDDATSYIGYSYVEKGFRLDNLAGAYDFGTYGTLNPFFSGSIALINDNDGGLTRLTQVGNGAFALNSIALVAMYPGYTEDGVGVTFTGIRTDSTTVTQTFHVADSVPGAGAQTFTFASGFNNLASVTWTNDPMYHQFDNINVAAVPEPESYAMLLAGMGLLGCAARRRKAA